MASLGYISEVLLPGASGTYTIRDEWAREKIEALTNATHFIGISSTEITDGGSQKPTINGSQVDPQDGDIVIYKENRGTVTDPVWVPLEFIYDGTNWQLLGDQNFDTLGDLAFKDNASASYTPEGSISFTTSTFQISPYLISSVATQVVLDSQYFPNASSVEFETHFYSYFNLVTGSFSDVNLLTANYASQVAVDAHMGISNVINSVSFGELPSISNSFTLTASVSNEVLIFNLSNIGFNPGTSGTCTSTSVVYPTSSDPDYLIVFNDIDTVSVNTINTSDIITGGTIYYDDYLGTPGIHVNNPTIPISATFSGSATTITVS